MIPYLRNPTYLASFDCFDRVVQVDRDVRSLAGQRARLPLQVMALKPLNGIGPVLRVHLIRPAEVRVEQLHGNVCGWYLQERVHIQLGVHESFSNGLRLTNGRVSAPKSERKTSNFPTGPW
jgi:hypothetical protein